MVHATGTGGGGVQDAQERFEPASDPSPDREAGGGAHHGGVPGLLPERDAADETVAVGAGADAARGAAIAVGHSNDGGAFADDGWPDAGDAAAHRARGSAEDDPASIEVGVAAAATAANSGRE